MPKPVLGSLEFLSYEYSIGSTAELTPDIEKHIQLRPPQQKLTVVLNPIVEPGPTTDQLLVCHLNRFLSRRRIAAHDEQPRAFYRAALGINDESVRQVPMRRPKLRSPYDLPRI